MEFTSELIWKWANDYLIDKDNGRTCCWKTESKENKSNKARYETMPDWFKFQIEDIEFIITKMGFKLLIN